MFYKKKTDIYRIIFNLKKFDPVSFLKTDMLHTQKERERHVLNATTKSNIDSNEEISKILILLLLLQV